MKITPDIPSLIPEAEDTLEVKALSRVKPVKPVRAHELPPLVVQQHGNHEVPPDLDERQHEKRHDPHFHGERRTYSRRTERLPILMEFRLDRNRRQSNQRVDDETEHIDVKV